MDNRTRKPCRSPLTRDVTSLIIILLAVMIFIIFPNSSNAARIMLQPGSVDVTTTPGGTTGIAFVAQLVETVNASPFANFSIALTSGTLPRAWLANSKYISLNNNTSSYQVSTTLTVPSDAQPGSYVGVLQPVGIRSNERVSTTSLTLIVEVAPQNVCSEPPIITNISAGETIVRAKSKEPLVFSFTGNISSDDGCTTENARLILTDEYGELSKTKLIELDSSGNFNTSVTVVAARKGKDKDGRLYSIIFGASNEAGDVLGGEQTIIIAHDHRDDHKQKEPSQQKGNGAQKNSDRQKILNHR